MTPTASRPPPRSPTSTTCSTPSVGLFLDPADPDVRKRALADGIPADWIEHAQRSPVHALVARYKVALPLHPEYRTMPMVWYVPPLSPIVNALEGDGYEADPDALFPAVEACGSRSSTSQTCCRPATPRSSATCCGGSRRCAATCESSRSWDQRDERLPEAVGMDGQELEDMYRLLAIADYNDRYVIPQAHAELADRLAEQGAGAGCSLDFEGGPGNCGAVAPARRALVHADRAPRAAAGRRRLSTSSGSSDGRGDEPSGRMSRAAPHPSCSDRVAPASLPDARARRDPDIRRGGRSPAGLARRSSGSSRTAATRRRSIWRASTSRRSTPAGGAR